MVFTENLNVPSSVNPFKLYLCVISNTDAQQHFLSQVSSAQPTSPRFITLQSYLRLPTALVSKALYYPAVLQQTCFLFFVRSKNKIHLLRFVGQPLCNLVHWRIWIMLLCNTKHWRHCAEEFTETCSATLVLDSFCLRAKMDYCVLRNCDTFGKTCVLYLMEQ
jgi:hypothetical protein